MTASQPFMPSSRPIFSTTSPATVSMPGGKAGFAPPARTSARTVCPSEISRLSRCPPTKPVAPVRKTFMRRFYMGGRGQKAKPENAEVAEEAEVFLGVVTLAQPLSSPERLLLSSRKFPPKNLCSLRYLFVSRFVVLFFIRVDSRPMPLV